MPFKSIDIPPRPKISDAIVGQIQALIVEGELSPGDTLPSERELAARFEVSRPTVREALLKLDARGLIEGRRGAGYAVKDATAPTITDPLRRLLGEHPKVAGDVLELREALEGMAAELAAQRATEQDIQRLEGLCVAMEQSTQERNGADLDAQFHLVLAEAAHNVALSHVMAGVFDLLRDSVRRSRETLFKAPDTSSALHEQHRAILEAVRAGDAGEAEAAARYHLNYVRTRVGELKGT